MRLKLLLCGLVLLSACSIEGVADKIWPDAVKMESVRVVDAVMASDADYFAALKSPGQTEEDFAALLQTMFDNRSEGAELERHVIGAKANTSMGTDTGTQKRYEAVYEVKTEQGFTQVSMVFVPNPETKTCCDLTFVNSAEVDISMHETFKTMSLWAKYIGLGLLLILVVVIGIIVSCRRKKKAAGADL